MATETQLMADGKKLATGGKLVAAQEAFHQALKLNPASADAGVWAARLALTLQQPDQALPHIEKVLAAHPDHAEALALKGAWLCEKERYAEAQLVLDQAVKQDPKLHMAYINLAICTRELGDLDGSEQAARRALAIKDEYGGHFELGHTLMLKEQPENGIAEVQKAIELNPAFIRGYMALGSLFVDAGDVDAAIALYQGAMETLDAPPLLEALCNALSLKLQFGQALEHARTLRDDRGLPEDHLRVGEYALAVRNLDEAIEANEAFSKLAPDAWQGMYNLGEIFSGMEDLDAAADAYTAAIERSGGKAWQPYNGMGLLLLHHGKDPREAGACFMNALTVAPGQPQALLNLALVQAQLKDWASARKFARMAMDNSDADGPLHQQAARLKTEVDRLAASAP